ncbi:hypothetical protein [Polymorphospora sp. NPDC050346]|uniref:hypothetical protein n=1 Tax=Polymorphospora sp. NPDC050346 TaxID=3155780 RepID=UPI0033C12069
MSDGDADHSPWHRSGEAALRGWSESTVRYDDPIRPVHEIRRPVNGSGPGHHAGDAAPVAVRAPASAPPYPYEGDLEDALREQRTVIPAARPGPTSRRPDPEPPAEPDPAEQARHAIGEPTPSGGLPAVPRWRSDRGTPGESHDETASPDAPAAPPTSRQDRPGGDRPGPAPRYGDRPQPGDRDPADRYPGPTLDRSRESGEPDVDRPDGSEPPTDRDAPTSGGQVGPTAPGRPEGYGRRRGPAPRLFGASSDERPDLGSDERPAFGRRAEAEAPAHWADSPAPAGRWTGEPAAATRWPGEPAEDGRRSGDPAPTRHDSSRTDPQDSDPGARETYPTGRRADPAGPSPWRTDSRRTEPDATAARRTEPGMTASRRTESGTPTFRRTEPDATAGRRGGGDDPGDDRRTRADWAPTWPETWRPGASRDDDANRPDSPRRGTGPDGTPAGIPDDQAATERPGVPRPWSAGWPGRATRPSYDPPSDGPATRAGYEPPARDTAGPGAPGPGAPGNRDDRFPAPGRPTQAGQPVSGSTPAPGPPSRAINPPTAVLPQRVPAEPDVPTVPEQQAVEPPPAETPELARIATHLRRGDGPPTTHEPPEEFDVAAIVAAVSEVAGVRDASLRTTPAGAHSLRLDLHDGADPAEVSRLVARLLQDRMGLAAAPPSPPQPAPAEPPPVPPASEIGPDVPRRRRQPATAPHRGRAQVEEPARAPRFPEPGVAAGVIGTVGGYPVAASSRGTVEPTTAGVSYQGGQITTTESAPSRPLNPGVNPGPRVVIDHVQVSTFGLDATVEVRLAAGPKQAAGVATGPAVDGYVLRLCAVSAALAIDELLLTSQQVSGRGRCFVEHAAVVPFGSSEVAVVVVLLVCGGWVEQLAGSALVSGDPRQAVVRATLAAVNRRLEALLSDGQ